MSKCYDVQKTVKEKKRLAMIDPEKAKAEKELGNANFKTGVFDLTHQLK